MPFEITLYIYIYIYIFIKAIGKFWLQAKVNTNQIALFIIFQFCIYSQTKQLI